MDGLYYASSLLGATSLLFVMLMYGLIHIVISVEGFALFLVFILWRHREGSATANQVVANRKHAIFRKEVGLEVCTSHLLTLLEY